MKKKNIKMKAINDTDPQIGVEGSLYNCTAENFILPWLSRRNLKMKLKDRSRSSICTPEEDWYGQPKYCV